MTSIDARSLAAHVVCALARSQKMGRAVRLDALAAEIDVRREDVRSVVRRLHLEGHVDARRMKVTLSGLAIAAALEGCVLRPVRSETESALAVA